jgi:hypothetical protein
MDADIATLVGKITAEFSALPEVTAVVLAGSRESTFSDDRSDIDLCIYTDPEPSEILRTGLAQRYGDRASIGNHFWEPGDEWIAKDTGILIDIMYRSPAWIAGQIDRVWRQHQASLGYTTCFVHNVLRSKTLYDRDGWYASIRAVTQLPYPEPLRRAIVAKNYPVLRGLLSSYVHQIGLALDRRDSVSINHRVTALLASCFDILFAINRVPHPGEKRLVAYVQAECAKRPPEFPTRIKELLLSLPAGEPDVLDKINSLLDDLDTLLLAEGLITR